MAFGDDVNSLPPTNNLPKEPVDIDEPLILDVNGPNVTSPSLNASITGIPAVVFAPVSYTHLTLPTMYTV